MNNSEKHENAGVSTEMRRRRSLVTRVVVSTLLIAVVGLGIALLYVTSSTSQTSSPENPVTFNFTEVQRRTLEDITTLDGTLGFVAGDPLVYSGSPDGIVTITSGSSGIVTSLPDEGATIREGEVLYTINENPVIVLYGEIPPYRSLSTRSSDGEDIHQLEVALERLGYNDEADMTVDDDFTTVTRDAVKDLQLDLGIDDSGVLVQGTYVFTEGPVFIAETLIDIGSTVNPSMPIIATSTIPEGTVTYTASEGDVLSHTDTLFVLEGSPVTLFVTDIPFYRTLDVGSVGEDVRVLEETIIDLGFNAEGALEVDGVFDEATELAVTAWQISIGSPPDGVVNIGEIMVTENPIRIAASHISIGSSVRSGSMLFTPSTSTSVVSVRLPANNQELLVAGDLVNIVMPNGDDEPATVTSVGTVAIRSQEFGTYFEVEVTLEVQGAAEGLDEAPVDVEVVEDRAENVLTVPVAALLALAEGGYAVEVDAGAESTKLVGVEVGMYADGSVEIISTGLEVGMLVVVP